VTSVRCAQKFASGEAENAYMTLEREFSATVGSSIYALLPGVVENTFGSPVPAVR